MTLSTQRYCFPENPRRWRESVKEVFKRKPQTTFKNIPEFLNLTSAFFHIFACGGGENQ